MEQTDTFFMAEIHAPLIFFNDSIKYILILPSWNIINEVLFDVVLVYILICRLSRYVALTEKKLQKLGHIVYTNLFQKIFLEFSRNHFPKVVYLSRAHMYRVIT